MKDFFIHIETTIGPRWIRSTEVTCIEPYDEKSCRITLKNQISYNSVFCELMVQNETADDFLTRLENGHQVRLIDCQRCQKKGAANVLAQLCHQCQEKEALWSNEEKLDAILPPLPKPTPPATQFRTEM